MLLLALLLDPQGNYPVERALVTMHFPGNLGQRTRTRSTCWAGREPGGLVQDPWAEGAPVLENLALPAACSCAEGDSAAQRGPGPAVAPGWC